MLRTIAVRNELLRNTIRKAIRSNLVRTLSIECSKVKHNRKQSSFLIPNQISPWRINSLRFYADLPDHTKVPLPALSPTMESGTVISWAKKEGDKLSEGDLLCEIETDKATMGFETPEEGYLAKIVVPAGTKDVKIGVLVCIIVENEADIAAFKDYVPDASAPVPSAPAAAAPTPAAAPSPAASTPSPAAPSPPPSAGPPGARVFASPLARKMAKEQGVELAGGGTGVYGSITSKDLGAMKARVSPMAAGLAQAQAARAGPAAPAPAGAAYVDTPVSNMRSVIARRLLESKTTIPHFYLSMNCNVDKMLAMRKRVNKKLEGEGLRVSVNDFVLKAVACASMAVPEVNAAWMGDTIRQYANVDISVAVSTPTGLITPIIFNANGKGIAQISREMKALAKKARENKLTPAEFQGGTISVSNLGMFGTSQFCAIINPPQSAIIAVGTNEERLVIDENSEKGFRTSQYVTFTMSGDHRVVDGALGAVWLKAFKGYIEDPETMIL